LAAAREQADELLAAMGDSPPKSRHVVDALWSAGEVYAACSLGRDAPSPRGMSDQRRLERVIRGLTSLGRLFPIARTKCRLIEGHLEVLRGRDGGAARRWRGAAQAFRGAEMPYHEAMALYWLGRLGVERGDRGRARLVRARELFAAQGCEGDVQRVDRALEGL
jgi:hypothetical protein